MALTKFGLKKPPGRKMPPPSPAAHMALVRDKERPESVVGAGDNLTSVARLPVCHSCENGGSKSRFTPGSPVA